MNIQYIKSIIGAFTLNQRNVSSSFKKDYGLNRTDVEILAFANTNLCFNAYQVHKCYPAMNMQQVRLGIRKLSGNGSIGLISSGIKGRPSVYMITNIGRDLLESYHGYWLKTFYPEGE